MPAKEITQRLFYGLGDKLPLSRALVYWSMCFCSSPSAAIQKSVHQNFHYQLFKLENIGRIFLGGLQAAFDCAKM